ncbi:metalloprotease [Coemansia sp. RSA 720]|nr:metalloprotease [Coemansia sp. RSA 720]
MQHSLFFKALFAIIALGMYNFYSSKWSPPSHSSPWSPDFVERQTASNLTYYAFSGQLEQSVGDTRQHQLIKLPNNMVVLCTSDPDSANTAASLSVNVGSMADPKEFPGMAHFLEHMLFMGSAKYPAENEYTQYIANNLVNAVDSEYKGNLQSYGRRLNQLKHSLSDPAHPYNHFNVGNLDTLQVAARTMGKNLHEEVMTFYQKYYSADIMKLAVAGNHSVEQLVEWTVEKFSKVESKGNTKLQYEGHPLDHHALGNSFEQLLNQVTIDGVQKHIETVFSAAYFKMLMVGNFEQTEAVDAALQVSQMLKSQPLPDHSHVPSQIVNIEPGHYIYRHMVKFDALVESIAGKANEQATSVDAEANRMWTPIDEGTYDFALLADEVESLQNARLDDVLDMWDRYINPETAIAYTRVDSQMWSIKKSYPSATDMATWPETILALAGCLESETHMPVDLADLSHFVHTAVTQTNTDALASLARLYSVANSTQVLNESAPGWPKIKNALDMAMYPQASHMLQNSKTDFAHIGMYQTVEGKWVITDVDKFKATQALHELPVPVINLIPDTLAN